MATSSYSSERQGCAGQGAQWIFGTSKYTDEDHARIQAALNTALSWDQINSRPGGGGKKVHYLAGHTVIENANRIFGFDGWDSSILHLSVDYVERSQDGRFWTAAATAIVRVVLANGVGHEDVGNAHLKDKDKGEVLERAKKAAVTDATKRALRLFGPHLGGNMSNKEELKDVERVHKMNQLAQKAQKQSETTSLPGLASRQPPGPRPSPAPTPRPHGHVQDYDQNRPPQRAQAHVQQQQRQQQQQQQHQQQQQCKEEHEPPQHHRPPNVVRRADGCLAKEEQKDGSSVSAMASAERSTGDRTRQLHVRQELQSKQHLRGSLEQARGSTTVLVQPRACSVQVQSRACLGAAAPAATDAHETEARAQRSCPQPNRPGSRSGDRHGQTDHCDPGFRPPLGVKVGHPLRQSSPNESAPSNTSGAVTLSRAALIASSVEGSCSGDTCSDAKTTGRHNTSPIFQYSVSGDSVAGNSGLASDRPASSITGSGAAEDEFGLSQDFSAAFSQIDSAIARHTTSLSGGSRDDPGGLESDAIPAESRHCGSESREARKGSADNESTWRPPTGQAMQQGPVTGTKRLRSGLP